MDEINQIRKITDQVEGFLGKREGVYLYRLAKIGAKIGDVVEIGSWKGKSTIWLAKGSQAVNGKHVYAIDPHLGGEDFVKLGYQFVDTVEEFKNNVERAGVGSIVQLIHKPSLVAVEGWAREIGLLWIDGDHSYEAVSADFYRWEPYVVDDGIVAFHDTYSWEGVRRLVDNELLKLSNYRVLGQCDGILAIQKVQRLSRVDLMRRHVVRLLRGSFNRARERRNHWRAVPRKILRGLAKPKS